MTTAAAALLEIARVVTRHAEGITSGAGTTTTLVDTSLTGPDDLWNGGIVFILSGTQAGKTATITDYVKLTGTITFAPALAGAPGAGDKYALCGAEFARSELLSALNLALDDLGALPQVNDTLTSVAKQEEYSLPAGVGDVRRVLVAANAADPYDWKEQYYWTELGGKLYFDKAKAPTQGSKKIRLVYLAPSAEVSADADTISDYIPIERIKWTAAVNAIRARYIDVGKDSQTILDRFKEAQGQADLAARRYPIQLVTRAPHYTGW